VVDQPKRLLAQLDNVTLVENKREKECCGFGGAFSVRQPEVSAAMVTDKVASIEETGATQVVSGDCGCLMNIGGALDKAGKPIKPKHIAEFLLDRLGPQADQALSNHNESAGEARGERTHGA
jgi:L-lactate dehydrogenase complex protein LldE